jgi:hypothetical protein
VVNTLNLLEPEPQSELQAAKYDLLNHFYQEWKGVDYNETRKFNWPKGITVKKVIKELQEDGWLIMDVTGKSAMFIGHEYDFAEEKVNRIKGYKSVRKNGLKPTQKPYRKEVK